MSALPPWDQYTFTFGWDPYTRPINQCAQLNIQYSTSLGTGVGYHANPPPTPPYQLILYRGGSQPLVIPVNNSGKSITAVSCAYAEDKTEQSGTFPWVVNLALGPSYTMAMKDAKGYSGGIVFVFTMAPGAGGCNLTPDPMKPSTLDVSVSGSVQCGQSNLVVSNGTAPYKLELVPENGQPKTLYFATNEFGITLDMTAGTQYFLVVSDSAGHISTSGLYNIEGSSDNSCIGKAQTVTVGMFSTLYPGSGTVLPTVIPTSSNGTSSFSMSITSTRTPINQDFNGTHKSTQPMTIGLAVGISVVVLALLAALLLFCRHRRRQRRSDAPTDGDHNPYGYDRPGYVVHPNFPPQIRQSFGPLDTVYEEGQDYPSYAVPEIQAETPGTTPELGDGRAFHSPTAEYGNTIFAPRPVSSYTSVSQSYPVPLSPQKGSQSHRLSQASDMYSVGSMEKTTPSAPELDSSAPLLQPASPPWPGYKLIPGQSPVSPPPRVGTATTGTSTVLPAYEEVWSPP